MLNFIFKTIFWLAVLFVLVTLYALTFGQSSPYEFADWKLSKKFYSTVLQGLPIAILLTLTGTIKRTNDKSTNINIFVVTLVGSIVSFFIMVTMSLAVGFLTITNETILYKHKTELSTTIVTQTIGQGVFGENGHRIVKLEPFLKFWNKTSLIDTAEIDKSDWIFVNEEIDLRIDE